MIMEPEDRIVAVWGTCDSEYGKDKLPILVLVRSAHGFWLDQLGRDEYANNPKLVAMYDISTFIARQMKEALEEWRRERAGGKR